MPVYTFRDTKNDTVFEIEMSMDELDQFKKEHPEFVQEFHSFPGMVRGVGTKPHCSGFNDVLKELKKKYPDGNINTY